MSDQTPIGFYSGKAASAPATAVIENSIRNVELNQPIMGFRAGKVRIEALLDLDGIAQLETSLAALKVLLRPKSAEDMRLENARYALRPDPFVLETEMPGLHILPLGHPARGRNGTLPFAAALERLARRYADSVIVLDTPPALSTSDPHAIAPHVAQVVLVVEAERTQRSEVEAALDLVRACPSVLAVLNKTRLTASHTFGSGDGYYYAASA